jgi:hypothetical protein
MSVQSSSHLRKIFSYRRHLEYWPVNEIIFRDISSGYTTPPSPLKVNQRFGGARHLHLLG